MAKVRNNLLLLAVAVALMAAVGVRADDDGDDAEFIVEEKKAASPVATAAPAAPAATGAKGISGMLADPALAEGLSKVVNTMQKSHPCKTAMFQCRAACGNTTSGSGCVMECETECSACVIEATGGLNNALCD